MVPKKCLKLIRLLDSPSSALLSSPILKLLMDSLVYNQGLQLQLDPSHDCCVFSMNSHCFKRVCFELNSVFCYNVQGLKYVGINVKTNWMSCSSDSRGWSIINSVFNLNLIWFIWHLSHSSKVESRGEKMNGRMGKIDSAQLNKQQQQFARWNFVSDKTR